MSRALLKEKVVDEELLSTSIAVELEDAKNNLSPTQIRKTQTHALWTVQLKRELLYREKFQRER